MEYQDLRLSLWDDPELRDELIGWVAGHVAARGARLLADPPQVRIRPWSTTARFTASDGAVWFKANAPGGEFEAALTGALSVWTPGWVATPLAVDAERGWSLLAGTARPLRDHVSAPDDFRAWEAMLAAYAELQRTLTGRVPDLLDLGVPDLRPTALGDRLDAFLDDPAVVEALGADHSTLVKQRPEFDTHCRLLTGSAIPPSLDHADLHIGNVLVRDGGYRFFDWGDSAVAHPFSSLLVPLRMAANAFGADRDQLSRLRAAFLEPWTADHPAAELHEELRLALSLAPVGRAVSWSRIFPELRPAVRHAHLLQVARWLRALIDGGPLP
ncbi:phosphotransferase [Marinactinospora rubrisoli]|uniref:Phosphotransferase n=1 Tax=Marinactinospora rubrisoli TaxID=2715399 RepID=A0ABW2KK86_9ACTN